MFSVFSLFCNQIAPKIVFGYLKSGKQRNKITRNDFVKSRCLMKKLKKIRFK